MKIMNVYLLCFFSSLIYLSNCNNFEELNNEFDKLASSNAQRSIFSVIADSFNHPEENIDSAESDNANSVEKNENLKADGPFPPLHPKADPKYKEYLVKKSKNLKPAESKSSTTPNADNANDNSMESSDAVNEDSMNSMNPTDSMNQMDSTDSINENADADYDKMETEQDNEDEYSDYEEK